MLRESWRLEMKYRKMKEAFLNKLEMLECKNKTSN